jgi:hypothetical protein
MILSNSNLSFKRLGTLALITHALGNFLFTFILRNKYTISKTKSRAKPKKCFPSGPPSETGNVFSYNFWLLRRIAF